MNPLAAQPDATVPRPIEQVGAQKPTNVIQDGWITRRMQAVTAVVDGHAGQVEPSGQSTDDILTLQDGDVRAPCLTKTVGSAQPGRTGSQDDYAVLGGHAFSYSYKHGNGISPQQLWTFLGETGV